VAEALNFPEGFLWGTASAAHQVEGDNRNNDWWLFEQEPGRIQGGDRSLEADDHYRRYREDFRLLRKMHNNAHRLSIEWSRVEPRAGEFDPRQLRHYRDVLGELREQGLRPMLTLHHFSSPIWFSERGGWTAAEAPAAFLRFVRRVVDELGDLVDLWCTINEPNIYAANGWVVGEFPPGRKGDVVGMWRVLANMRRAHLVAYRAIHERLPDAAVGLSHHRFLFLPERAVRRDRLAARLAGGFMERWPVGRLRREPVVEAEADWIGIAHYWAQNAAFDPRRPRAQFLRLSNVPGLPVTDMGWASDPSWMRRVLNEVRHLGKAVYVTENGISTRDDAVRAAYLPQVLRSVHGAIEDGVDVRGYFHWTGFDNFEWARGYSQKFGLIAVDRATQEREVKPSGHLYARIAAANAVESE
jgi:beta-glucosidase